MTRYGRLVAATLAMGLLAGTASAQGGPRGDQRGGDQHGEDQRGGGRGDQRHGDRGPDGPPRGPERPGGPRAYDSRGGYRGAQDNWRRGDRIDRDDWNGGGRIDYRQRHLRQPPRGYEWREVNGSLILGAIATGVIADILLNQR